MLFGCDGKLPHMRLKDLADLFIFDCSVLSETYPMKKEISLILLFFLVIHSSCLGNRNEFKGGRVYKHETPEEWDKKTKDSKMRKILGSTGLKDTILDNLLKKNTSIKVKISTSMSIK